MVEAPQHQRPLHQAVIPVAGLGTRFLPATKALPRRCCRSWTARPSSTWSRRPSRPGCRMTCCSSRDDQDLPRGPLRPPPLPGGVAGGQGDYSRAALVQEPATLGHMFYVRQGRPLGLGTPCCGQRGTSATTVRRAAGRRPGGCRESRCCRGWRRCGRSTAGRCCCSWRCPTADLGLRLRRGGAHRGGRRGARDRPDREAAPGTAPSNLAVIGRYVLDPRSSASSAHGAGRGARSSSPTRWSS